MNKIFIFFFIVLSISCINDSKHFKNNIVNHQEPNEVYTTIEILNNNKSIIHELDVLEKSNLTNEIEIITDHITKRALLSLGKDTLLTSIYKSRLNVTQFNKDSDIIKIFVNVDSSMSSDMVKYLNQLTYELQKQDIEKKQEDMQSTLDSIQNEISILENNIELELLNNDAKYIALLQIKLK